MAGPLSLEHLRRVHPAHYVAWVRAGCLLAVVGYAAVVATHLTKPERLFEGLEVVVLGVCALGLVLTFRRRVRLAAWLVLLAVSIEFAATFLASPFGMANGAALVLPALIAGVALLLGARVALGWAVAASFILPGLVVLGGRLGVGPGIQSSGHVVSLAVGAHAAAVLLYVFQRSYGEVLTLAQERELQARQLLEATPDGILALDQLGTVEVANDAAVQLLEGSREKLVGLSFDDFDFWCSRGERLTLPRTDGPLDFEELQVGATGRFLEARFRPREGHGLGGWLLVLRDITARKEAEARADELRQQLLHAQKMEAIGRLAGGVAHDFNNVLTAIGGYAELLADSDDAETRELAEEQLEAHERGAALTRQLLAFARKEIVRRQPVDLRVLLEGMEKLVRRLAGEATVIDLDLEGPAPIVADTGQLEQIVMNLAVNARDAMGPEGGTLTLRCRATASEVVLEVADTGAGMDELTRRRLFEPFFTTKERGKGTGLGLATVHAIVEEHEGAVTVHSEPGQGATFRIVLPRSTQAPSDAPTPVVLSGTRRTRGTVLLAEDDQLTREVVRRQLVRAGYVVHAVESGAEALGALRSLPKRPQILLTDVMMPGMTGPELAERVQREFPGLPVLYMSGYVDDALDMKSIDAGRDLILKPFTREALVQRLEAKLVASDDLGARTA